MFSINEWPSYVHICFMICLALGNGYWRLVIKPWYPSGCIGMHGGTEGVLVGVMQGSRRPAPFPRGSATLAPMPQCLRPCSVLHSGHYNVQLCMLD